MRAATETVLGALLLLGACTSEGTDQSRANEAVPVDIETLPPDESVATKSEELANGVNEPKDDPGSTL